MAERTGLEPATSGVTGQHSNQLNYHSAYCNCYRPTSRPGCHCMQWRVELAERTGLEPATSGVTGQHSNQLNYRSTFNTARRCFYVVGAEGFEPPTLSL